jgi:hypothetical protein
LKKENLTPKLLHDPFAPLLGYFEVSERATDVCCMNKRLHQKLLVFDCWVEILGGKSVPKLRKFHEVFTHVGRKNHLDYLFSGQTEVFFRVVFQQIELGNELETTGETVVFQYRLV